MWRVTLIFRLCMPYGQSDVLPADATVNELLRPLFAFFEREPSATELCINRPGQVFVEVGAAWHCYEAPALTYAWALSVATAIATYTEQVIGPLRPILSAMLPGGERIQIVVPPAVEQGIVSMTVRIPIPTIKPLTTHVSEGLFERFVWAKHPLFEQRAQDLPKHDLAMCEDLENNRLLAFIQGAIAHRKNIAIVGDTGSGKTTLMKSICQLIPPAERLITIEDVRELFLPVHPNRVHLLYSKDQQGVAQVSPADLIASNMRMKPSRVLLAELRGSEAFDFLKLLTTGHSGSVTSFHAESCALAQERFVFMCKEHTDASAYDPDSLKRLMRLTIDVIMHIKAVNRYDEAGNPTVKDRYVTEVQFDPVAKLVEQFGSGKLHAAPKRK